MTSAASAMKMPTCRPCSCASPQNTGSFAPATTSLDTGTSTRAGSSFCSGPPRPNTQTPTQIAVQLSMIVVITSLVPATAFSRPAMPAHTATEHDAREPRHDHVQQRGHPVERGADPDGEDRADDELALAADVEQAAAERERHRQAGEDQRRRDDQRLLEVQRREDAVVLRQPREDPVEAGALEDRRVGLDRVVAGDQHHQAAGDERDEHGDERRDEPAAAQIDRCPVGDGEVGREFLGGVAHAASVPRPPPVMYTPKSSSEDSGGKLGDDPAFIDHEHAVAERADLLELQRHEQHGLAGVALLDEPPVDELDRADVQAARGLRGDDHLRARR